jgi:hypothetical protein
VILGLFFGLSAVFGLLGLCAIAPRSVPPISGTCAFILTLAALGVAIVR